MKVVLVSAVALLDKDNRVLLAQRPKGKSMEGLWEFPGGKIEADETAEACLYRELNEEYQINVSVNNFVGESVYEYPNKKIIL